MNNSVFSKSSESIEFKPRLKRLKIGEEIVQAIDP